MCGGEYRERVSGIDAYLRILQCFQGTPFIIANGLCFKQLHLKNDLLDLRVRNNSPFEKVLHGLSRGNKPRNKPLKSASLRDSCASCYCSLLFSIVYSLQIIRFQS